VGEKHYAQSIKVVAGTVLLASRAIWQRLFEAVSGSEVLAVLTRTMYDETPMKLRGSKSQAQNSGSKTAEILKMFQADLEVGIVCRDRESTEVSLIRGRVPAELRAVQSVTAEAIQELMLDWWPRRFRQLFEVRRKCKFNVDISVSDRGASNLKYERSAQANCEVLVCCLHPTVETR
jgi:hypothetical protein